jgi:hypothetical protein
MNLVELRKEIDDEIAKGEGQKPVLVEASESGYTVEDLRVDKSAVTLTSDQCGE